jgi:hypothetical protein
MYDYDVNRYDCANQLNFTRAIWELLGYFNDGDCGFLQSVAFDFQFCQITTTYYHYTYYHYTYVYIPPQLLP